MFSFSKIGPTDYLFAIVNNKKPFLPMGKKGFGIKKCVFVI
jgi:hypothetical protein